LRVAEVEQHLETGFIFSNQGEGVPEYVGRGPEREACAGLGRGPSRDAHRIVTVPPARFR